MLALFVSLSAALPAGHNQSFAGLCGICCVRACACVREHKCVSLVLRRSAHLLEHNYTHTLSICFRFIDKYHQYRQHRRLSLSMLCRFVWHCLLASRPPSPFYLCAHFVTRILMFLLSLSLFSYASSLFVFCRRALASAQCFCVHARVLVSPDSMAMQTACASVFTDLCWHSIALINANKRDKKKRPTTIERVPHFRVTTAQR